jgi:GT2 family glycosyltransferase
VVERLALLHDTAFEIIVVIDDVEPHRLDRQRHVRSRARFITTGARLGPAAARNLGASVATRELLCFMDADVLPNPGALRDLCRSLETSPFSAIFPRILPAGVSAHTAHHFTGFPLDLGTKPGIIGGPSLPYAPAATFTIRRAAFWAVGGFDLNLRLGEDVDLVVRLVEHEATLVYLPWITFTHLPTGGASRALRRSLSYGLSYRALAHAHPHALQIHRGKLTPWFLDGVAVLGGGIPAIGLLLADASTHLGALASLGELGANARSRFVFRRLLGVTNASIDHLLSNQLMPLLIGAIVRRRTRRFVAALVVIDLLRGRIEGLDPSALWRRNLHRLGYSAGLWLSRLLR